MMFRRMSCLFFSIYWNEEFCVEIQVNICAYLAPFADLIHACPYSICHKNQSHVMTDGTLYRVCNAWLKLSFPFILMADLVGSQIGLTPFVLCGRKKVIRTTSGWVNFGWTTPNNKQPLFFPFRMPNMCGIKKILMPSKRTILITWWVMPPPPFGGKIYTCYVDLHPIQFCHWFSTFLTPPNIIYLNIYI